MLLQARLTNTTASIASLFAVSNDTAIEQRSVPWLGGYLNAWVSVTVQLGDFFFRQSASLVPSCIRRESPPIEKRRLAGVQKISLRRHVPNHLVSMWAPELNVMLDRPPQDLAY
jgi:hypothetical protein